MRAHPWPRLAAFRPVFQFLIPGWLALASAGLLLLGSARVRAQDQPAPDPAPLADREALRNAFLAKQMTLAQEEQSLEAGGANPEQLHAWREANATRFAAQVRRAQQIALQAALDPAPLMTSTAAAVPTESSPALAAALATRTKLTNGRAQIHNQLVQAMPADPTEGEIGQMQEREEQLVAQQFGADEALQVKQAKTLADDSAAQIQPLPPPCQIPPGATPQLAAFLATRDQLMREEVQLRNQYAAADPAMRRTAVQQWREQNASRFAQLHAQAAALLPNP